MTTELNEGERMTNRTDQYYVGSKSDLTLFVADSHKHEIIADNIVDLDTANTIAAALNQAEPYGYVSIDEEMVTFTTAEDEPTPHPSWIALYTKPQPQGVVVNNSLNVPDGWISVSDRLPEEGEAVLAVVKGVLRTAELRWEHPSFEDSYEAFRYWDDPNDDGQNWDWYDVTHWMPLPAAPSDSVDTHNSAKMIDKEVCPSNLNVKADDSGEVKP